MLADAVRHHQSGRLNEAEQRYRWILRTYPHHAEALHLLGVLAHQVGRPANAVELIGLAIAQEGAVPAFHDSLANTFHALGRRADAVASYRRSLVLNPANPRTHYNLGVVLQEQGRPAEAAECYRRALVLEPADAETQVNLGNALKQLGQLDEAAASYRQALATKPDYAMAHYNLGIILQERGELEAAATLYRQALLHHPTYAAALYNLGLVLLEQGRLDEAATSCRAALALTPDHAEAHNNLGAILQQQGLLEEAAESYGRAITLKPGFAEAYNNLGSVFQEQGRLEEAAVSYETALAHKPDYAEAAMGRAFTQLYRSGVGLAKMLAQSRGVSGICAARFQGRQPDHVRPPRAERLPRIGFVSADFRSHAVGSLVLPAIEGLARAGYSLACYSNSAKTDALTARFIAAAAVWRSVAALPDDALAELIRSDGIDILVDLSGYSAGNRLPVFVRKPAPIQVTWIGYPATTGLAAIDYILADRHQLPPEAEPYYTELPVRLGDCYVTFEPPQDAPAVADLPALSRGKITFGSFNALKKITPEVVALWSRIVTRLPASRLLVKAPALDCPETRQRYAAQFAAHGIAQDRLVLIGRTSRAEHLGYMQQADIALDSFPYAGGQTTLEALWMGLPVIALPGETFASRHSLSYLSTMGLSDLAASSVENYIELAVGLATNQVRLSEIRSSLRSRISASPLCDTDRFADDLSHAFAAMWQRWCSGQPAASINLFT